MVVGILRIELHIPGNNSLKAKRQVLKSLKDRINNNFNVSVAEVDDANKWQRATVGIAAVGSDKRYVNGILSRVIDAINQFRLVELIDCQMEML